MRKSSRPLHSSPIFSALLFSALLLSALLLSAPLLLISATAVAQSDGRAEANAQAEGEAATNTDDAARRAFRLGQAHYENGDFQQAAVAFEEAFRLSNRARLLFNAYLAYRDAQDLPNAARTLEQFLELSPDIAEHDQLARRLEAIRQAMRDRGSSQSTEGAEASGGGEGAEASGGGEASEGAQAGEGGEGETGPSTESGFNPSPVGFIVAGLGVAMVIGGAITGAMASADNATLEQMCDGVLCPEDLRPTRDRGATLALVTDILLPVGAVAAVAGTVLIFVLQDEPAEDSPQVSAMCTGEGCFGALTGRF